MMDDDDDDDEVPSLSSICILILAKFPDQIRIPVRLHYSELTLTRHPLQLCRHLDPLLWITLVQIYDHLPDSLSSCNIPLYYQHLPLLQRVLSTSNFSLITILDLPACPDLNDQSIYTLNLLHSLVAFDASATSLSSYAIKVLARTLVYTQYDTTRRGPWPLRILRLRDCRKIDNTVYSHISLFPLLSVVDLRGTGCTHHPSTLFRPAATSSSILYHPSPLSAALSFLQSTAPLHSSQNVFSLHITTLHHPPLPHRRSTIAPQNSFVVIPSKHSKLIMGDAEALQSHVDIKRHEWHRNSTIATDTKVRIYRPFAHSEVCSCGGKPEKQDDASNGYSKKSAPSSRPSPLFIDASMSELAPLSTSASDTRPSPSPSAVDAETAASLTPPTTGIQQLLPYQAPHHTSLSSTASFYYHEARRDTLSHKGYSADAYYARARAAENTEYGSFLMLYRDPPPWSILETAASSSIPEESVKKRAVTAKLDRNQVENTKKHDYKRAALEALRKSATRTVSGQRGPSRPYPHSPSPSTSTQSRNPFRPDVRKREPQSQQGTSRSQGSVKPLKPISAVKIPSLPSEMRRQSFLSPAPARRT